MPGGIRVLEGLPSVLGGSPGQNEAWSTSDKQTPHWVASES